MLTRTMAALAVLLYVCPAVAEAPDPTSALATDARVTATRLRHRWDDARKRDAVLSSCLEPRVAEAMTLVERIERKGGELRSATTDAERARVRRALAVLSARRAELEDESRGCGASTPLAAGTTKVTVHVLASIAPIDPGAGGHPELLRALTR